jgi:hypothetical protein
VVCVLAADVRDQTDDDGFELTRESLAEILGVPRSKVTTIACMLQQSALIGYRRGALTMLDRPELEAAACECYRIVRNRLRQLLARPFD